MSVADRCGLTPGSPLMEDARAAWHKWCQADAQFAAIGDLCDAPQWTRRAGPAAKKTILAQIAALTATDRDAVAVLVWLMLPGATSLSAQLGDVSEQIDDLVAGQLWIECAQAYRLNPKAIAPEVLRRTRREVCAELGLGEGARRRDRAWESVLRVARFEETVVDESRYIDESAEVDGFDLVTELVMEAMDAGVIEVFDAWLVDELARVAARLGAPGRRGRMGLTTPAVVEDVAAMVRLSPRALRRRASAIVDRLTEYVRVRDDPDLYAAWRADHPRRPISPREEMQLVIDEDSVSWIRGRDLDPAWQVRDGLHESRRRRSG